MNILDTLDDQTIFASQFRDPETWGAWRAFLAALFALPMDEDMRSVFTQCTGRQRPPGEPIQEAWLVIGRRGGKSFALALIAVYLACFRDWRPLLGPGERATVMVIAADRKQARVIMRYCLGLLRAVPMLARIIEGATRDTINLSNRVTIEVHSASFRTTRGYSICAALCDELAFWRDEESANPDTEVIAALRPAMATVPGALLLCPSSPYRPSQKPNSDLYRDLLPSINSGSVELLDNQRLLSQLVGLERRSGRSGRDLIDHPPGAHDHLANAAAGAIDLALAERRSPRVSVVAPIVVNAHPEPINLNRDPELRRW